MIINLVVLLLVIGLAAAGGRLAWRAVRARRLWVRIAGGLTAGVLALLLAAVAFFGGKGLAALYFPGAPAAPDLAVSGTPDQVARGEYLVGIACVGCHGAVDGAGTPTGAPPLSGGWNIAATEGFGFIGAMITENLTPGGKLAGYSDGELLRVLRHGVNQEGRLLGFMPFLPYGQLSDEDTVAIIAYLRTLPPVTAAGPTGDRLNFLGAVMFGAGLFGAPQPAAETVSAPPAGATAAYGQYVATFGECRGCHGPDATGVPATSMFPAVPNPRPLVSTLSQVQFVEMMRTGSRPGNNPFPDTMPWENASKMTDDDLAALYAYLTAPAP